MIAWFEREREREREREYVQIERVVEPKVSSQNQ